MYNTDTYLLACTYMFTHTYIYVYLPSLEKIGWLFGNMSVRTTSITVSLISKPVPGREIIKL